MPKRLKKIRTVAVFSGDRADFGLLAPVMEAIRSAKGLRLKTVVAGSHLSRKYGLSLRHIETRFSIDAKVPTVSEDDTGFGTALSLSKGIAGITRALRRIRPDALLVLGDRTEALAAALAAHHLGIVVGHLHGGETTEAGHDDPARHAISRFAHLHFPATREAERRLIRMGEERRRIHRVGGPGIDVIHALKRNLPVAESIRRRYGLPSGRPYLVVLHHPVTSHPATGAKEIREVLAGVADTGMPAVLLSPNSDAGSRRMLAAIRQRRGAGGIRFVPTLAHPDYLALLARSAAIVGNSSSGILEASALKIPSVQVGRRQRGRERGANVIDCEPTRVSVAAAIRRGTTDRAFQGRVRRGTSPYGDGRASERIVRALARIRVTPELLQKRLSY